VIAPDSSVVIAALAPWHEAHDRARAALLEGESGLPAHVAVETTSALSRMPRGRRIAPAVVLEALQSAFPREWLALDADGQRDALRRAVAAGVRGGALYDALIAATAAAHDAEVLSADRRALETYRAMGVDVRLVDS
jgi:predicted nucleic acid-binding protein